jgi:Co/Zn/Cd efflux system component
MFRLTTDRGGSVELAAGVDEVEGIEEVTTLVALVTACIVVVAAGAFTLNVTISQEGAVLLTEGLLGGALVKESIFMEALEDSLGDLGVVLGRGAAEVIESDVEPLVNLLVDLVILCAKLLRRDLLL